VRTNRAHVTNKKLSYGRVTARCVLSVVMLPITTQQCRNYSVAAKLVNGPWCKKNRWAPYSHREKFH